MKKLNIGIDIDDTITNNEFYAQNFCERYLEKWGMKRELINPKTSLLSIMFKWEEGEFEEFWKREGMNFLRNTPVRSCAQTVLQRLKNEGHNIYIITQRYIEGAYDFSYEYLTQNGIVFDELIVEAKDKLDKCKEYGIDIFVDDRIATCEKLNANNILCYVMNTYFNDQPTSAPRVKNFADFYYKVNQLSSNPASELSAN
jgi:uncharacterized HAD superfamily protein